LGRYTTIRVDPEVWECLVNRQALLTVKRGRRASMSDAVKDILQEAAEAEAAEPGRPEEEDSNAD